MYQKRGWVVMSIHSLNPHNNLKEGTLKYSMIICWKNIMNNNH